MDHICKCILGESRRREVIRGDGITTASPHSCTPVITLPPPPHPPFPIDSQSTKREDSPRHSSSLTCGILRLSIIAGVYARGMGVGIAMHC